MSVQQFPNFNNQIKHEKSHSILLIQCGSISTRTFSDYESVGECMMGISRIFELYLKEVNPHLPQITYEISDLLHFIDEVPDMTCLVFKKSHNMYVPYNKDWIKEKVYNHFRRIANNNSGS